MFPSIEFTESSNNTHTKASVFILNTKIWNPLLRKLHKKPAGKWKSQNSHSKSNPGHVLSCHLQRGIIPSLFYPRGNQSTEGLSKLLQDAQPVGSHTRVLLQNMDVRHQHCVSPSFCRWCLFLSSGAPLAQMTLPSLIPFILTSPWALYKTQAHSALSASSQGIKRPLSLQGTHTLTSSSLSLSPSGLSSQPLGSVSRTPQRHSSPWPGPDEYSNLCP